MEPTSAPFARAILVRLFRLWAMAREGGTAAMPVLHDAAGRLSLPDETAAACASLFELVESRLGRVLVRERSCARRFSADERALLWLIEAAPSVDQIRATARVPHGLPGAIRWAAMTVRGALGWPARTQDEGAAGPAAANAACPFAQPGERAHAV